MILIDVGPAGIVRPIPTQIQNRFDICSNQLLDILGMLAMLALLGVRSRQSRGMRTSRSTTPGSTYRSVLQAPIADRTPSTTTRSSSAARRCGSTSERWRTSPAIAVCSCNEGALHRRLVPFWLWLQFRPAARGSSQSTSAAYQSAVPRKIGVSGLNKGPIRMPSRKWMVVSHGPLPIRSQIVWLI
jgi:hypothetical protein